MDYEEIKKIIKDMEESKLSELELEFTDGTKIKMKKEDNKKDEPVEKIERREVETVKPVSNEVIEENYKLIKSPMVGTFYSKANPDAKQYVTVGSHIKKGDIVCIIEAMKLMNEIEADVEGEVVEICVNDGEAVDYGKVLFKIK